MSTGRPEDRNATQASFFWPSSATLAELEAAITELRRRGAPDDAHPQVGASSASGELTFLVCVTRRQ